MSKGEPPRESWILDNWISLLSLIVSIGGFLLDFWGAIQSHFFDKELHRWIYVAVWFSIFYVILRNAARLCKELWKYSRKKNRSMKRLRRRTKRKEVKKAEFGWKKDSIETQYKEDRNSVLGKRVAVCFFGIFMLAMLCWSNPQNTSACAEGIKVILKPVSEEVSDDSDSEGEKELEDPDSGLAEDHQSEDSSEEEKTESTKEPLDSAMAENEGRETEDVSEVFESNENTENYRKEKPEEYRFVLEEPDEAPVLNEEIKNQVFFYGIEDEENLTRNMNTFLKLLKGEKIQGIPCNQIHDENGNDYYTYISAENSFKKAVNDNLDWFYLDDWLDNAPRSSELDAYIKGRKLLNSFILDEETEEGQDEEQKGEMNEEKDEEQSEEQLEEKRCWDLWWKLANDYQYYAQEYEFQTQNDQAVLYYYTMSIYCCMEALKYEMPQETYDMIYDYMVLRYLDLGREDSLIPGNLKSRASNIGSYLGNFCGK